jgi:FAD-dependent urate hydroxylase
VPHAGDPAVAVIGAGPYGLSIAAHLRYQGVDFRIFGTPMHRWQAYMPKGMFLKSEGCASNLFDPTGAFTLRQYCTEEGLPYAAYAAPVPLDVFTRYGLSFQRRFVPTGRRPHSSCAWRMGRR